MKIIVISIDSLRADSLSGYGYGRATSPRIDALAREGVLFRNAYAQSNWTFPSFYSLITGLYPGRLGITRFDQKIVSPVDTLPGMLARAGWRTLLFSSLQPLLDPRRFGRHFGETVKFDIDHDRGKLKAKLKSGKRDPLFALIHVQSYVHEPFRAPPGLVREFWTGPVPDRRVVRELTGEIGLPDESLRDVLRSVNLRKVRLRPRELAYLKACYDAGIRLVDQWVGDLADFLRSEFGDGLILIVTADHGQGFLEHGLFGHGLGLHQELVRVPLVFWWKGGATGREIDSPVQLIDLFPTLAGVLGAAGPGPVDGVSFRDCLHGAEDEDRLAVCEGFPFAAVIRRGKKLIVSFYRLMSGRERFQEIRGLLIRRRLRKAAFHLYSCFATRFYDLETDPGERRNLIRRERDSAAEMRTRLKAWYRDCRGGALEVASEKFDDEATIQQLKGLGYL